MPESTVTSKGQITIPKVVRERLHLETGDTVYFEIRDDGTALLVPHNEPVESFFGMLKGKTRLRRPLTIAEMNPASADDA